MRIIFILSLFFVSIQSLYSLDVPYLAGRVNDHAGVLSEPAAAELEKTLKDFEKKTSCQIAVLTINSLEGENIEQYSIRVAETWKLGQKGKDNGVLFLMSKNDRRMRIEVGYGLEDTLTDLVSGRIIADRIAPHFKNGDYDAGITSGIKSIISTIETGKYASSSGNVAAEAETFDQLQDTDLDSELGKTPVPVRIFAGIFIFSILGIFTFLMLFAPGFAGVFVFFFLIPFWAIFPIIVVGFGPNFVILALYVIGTPAAKIFLKTTKKGKKFSKKMKFFSSGSCSSLRSSGFSSSGSSFSGGGGSFGGGGASGSW